MRGHYEEGYVEFQPRARLLKLIGSELISDDVLAITELVKNAHDADASRVTVHFLRVTDPEGSISVSDDGHGMNLETLLGHWMQPAGTSKSRSGRRTTRRGRRMLGEKGVGRFATDKLARRLELVSRCAGELREIHACFDWDEFDTDERMLAEIKSRWEVRAPRVMKKHGTVLTMTGLRTIWNERMFRRMCTRLSRLRSPFSQIDGFAIHIESDEFPQYSGELRSDILEKAPYRIDAVFDGVDRVDVTVNGVRVPARHQRVAANLRCGPVRVRVFAFDLETDAIARIGPRAEVRAWLREWSGVSIYRDGFRVWPYGEPGDDWLQLDQQRVNNPVVRLSSNQVVGFVEIGRDQNPELVDQTNREGLLHTGAFDDLRRLLSSVFEILESRRQELRHPISKVPRSHRAQAERTGGDVGAEIMKLAAGAPSAMARDLHRVAAKVRSDMVRVQEEYRRTLEGYTDLAAAGQVALGKSEIVATGLGRVDALLARLKVALPGRGAIRESLDEIDRTIAALRVGTAATAVVVSRSRRRVMDVPTELKRFREVMCPILEVEDASMEIEAPSSGVLRVEMRPETFHRVLHILTTNSLEWRRRSTRPQIRIAVTRKNEICQLLFSDNGSGIPSQLADQIFEPMFSARERGLGMGLAIVRSIVNTHGGSIEADLTSRRRGARLRILLPRKRSRATM